MGKGQVKLFSRAEFADRLRQERRSRGLNQTEFASIGGVGLQTQSRYELGETEPNAAYLAAICAAGVDVGFILTGRRSSESLDIEASELVTIFLAMPPDMRAGLLTFARSMDGYISKHDLRELPESRVLHGRRLEYRGDG